MNDLLGQVAPSMSDYAMVGAALVFGLDRLLDRLGIVRKNGGAGVNCKLPCAGLMVMEAKMDSVVGTTTEIRTELRELRGDVQSMRMALIAKGP